MASLSALRDGIQALTNLFLDWQEERENTGRWPFGEIAACLGFGVAVLCSFVFLLVMAIPRELPDWQVTAILLAYVVVVVLAGRMAEGKNS